MTLEDDLVAAENRRKRSEDAQRALEEQARKTQEGVLKAQQEAMESLRIYEAQVREAQMRRKAQDDASASTQYY